jgi:uncharacterized membrane protein YpjA
MSDGKVTTKTIGYGFVSWAIPFVVSLLFFEKGGQPKLPVDLIKSIMIVVGAASGGVLLLFLFKQIRPSLLRGIVIGSLWFVINIVLDLAILVPMTKMSLGQYFSEIGVRYLLIPIMAGLMAAVSRRDHVST